MIRALFDRRSIPPALATLAVQISDMAAQLIASLLIGRLLGPQTMGEFTFVMAVAAIVSIFLLFGTEEIATQLYTKGTFAPQSIMCSSAVMWLAGAVVCVSLALAIYVGMGLPSSSLAPLLLAMAVLLLNGIGVIGGTAIISYAESARDIPNALIARGGLVVGVTVACIHDSLCGALVAYVVASATLVVLRARLIHRRLFALEWKWNCDVILLLWRRGRKIGIGCIFGAISGRSDILLLRDLSGQAEVGLYGAAYRVINGISAATQAVAGALYPGMVRSVQTGVWNRSHRLFVTLPVVSFAFLMLVASLGAASAVTLIFGEAYAGAVPILRILLFSVAIKSAVCFLSPYLVANNGEGILPFAQGVGAVTNVGLNLFLIPNYGGLGAAFATLLGDVVLTTVYLVELFRRRRVGSPTRTEESEHGVSAYVAGSVAAVAGHESRSR